MKRRDFNRAAAAIAGGAFVPGTIQGLLWPTSAYGSSPAMPLSGVPRFQLSPQPFYTGTTDFLLDAELPVSEEERDSIVIHDGIELYWRVLTDGMVHYIGRLRDDQRYREVVQTVNEVTLPFLNALHGTNVAVESDTPITFALEQNYPNPFNPSTAIPYSTETAGPVDLRIFDSVGREVAVLVDRLVGAGRHTARWNATGWASGTYVAVLRSGLKTRSRPILLVR